MIQAGNPPGLNENEKLPSFPIPWTPDSDAGVFLFNQREYWCAREAWERVWNETEAPAKLFYQGLSLLAAGYVSFQQRDHKGAAANLRKGLDRFHALDDAVGDLDVPIHYKNIVNRSRGVRVSLLDQGEARLVARAWDLWPRIEFRE
jgi:tetratricopeptide (TPR) repeat protein